MQINRLTQWVSSVAFSPDGTRVDSGSEDCTIRVWKSLHVPHPRTQTTFGGLNFKLELASVAKPVHIYTVCGVL